MAPSRRDGSCEKRGEDASGASAGAVIAALLASVGGLLFGLDIGYIGPIQGFPGFQQSVNGGREIGGPDRGHITAVFSLGAVVACLPPVVRACCDGLGRRTSILGGALLFGASAAVQATANGIPQILVGRFFGGVAVGILSNAVPLYQSEVAPKAWRGTLGATYQLSITVGIALAFAIDHAVDPKSNTGWRQAIWLQLVPAAFLAIGALFVPRSPRWLLLRCREEEAERALVWLRSSEAAARAEFMEVSRAVAEDAAAGEAPWGDLFASAYVGRLVLTCMALMLLQQLCGMNAFMYYGTLIFGAMEVPEVTFNAWMGVLNVLATIPGLLLVDRVGRVSLLRLSGSAMLLCNLACAILGSIFIEMPHGCSSVACTSDARVTSVVGGAAVVAAVFVFVASFACGWGVVAWVYCAEVFPLRYRSAALGTATTTLWAGNYLIAYLTPVLFELMHFRLFFVFAFFCALGVLLSCWLPETKGLALEQMPSAFECKLRARFQDGPLTKLSDSPATQSIGGYGATSQRYAA